MLAEPPSVTAVGATRGIVAAHGGVVTGLGFTAFTERGSVVGTARAEARGSSGWLVAARLATDPGGLTMVA